MALNFRHLILLIAACVYSNTGIAQEKAKTKTPQERQSSKAIPVSMSIDQEDDALKFARQHHPELAKLLEQLRKVSPAGFSQGIRAVHVSSQRLERYRDRQPARFAQELQNWKTDSNIRLLTAKWVMSQDPELEAQIRLLLRKRQQAKIDRLKAERKRMAERLEELDDQIGMGTSDLEADLVAEWDRLSKRAAVSAKTTRKRTLRNTDDNDNLKSKAKSKTAKTKQ